MRGDDVFFAATGISGGNFLRGVHFSGQRRGHPLPDHTQQDGHPPLYRVPPQLEQADEDQLHQVRLIPGAGPPAPSFKRRHAHATLLPHPSAHPCLRRGGSGRFPLQSAAFQRKGAATLHRRLSGLPGVVQGAADTAPPAGGRFRESRFRLHPGDRRISGGRGLGAGTLSVPFRARGRRRRHNPERKKRYGPQAAGHARRQRRRA
ncbi:MAG: hypothetical protein V8Q84_12610 [Bilophila sp.]